MLVLLFLFVRQSRHQCILSIKNIIVIDKGETSSLWVLHKGKNWKKVKSCISEEKKINSKMEKKKKVF